MIAPCLSGCLSKLQSLGIKMNAEKRRENEASADLCTAIVEIVRKLR